MTKAALSVEVQYYLHNPNKLEMAARGIIEVHGFGGYLLIRNEIKKQTEYSLTKRRRRYDQKVRALTERQNLSSLDGFSSRGFNDMHVDHIVSVWEAFKSGWSIEDCADISNLQMLPRIENMRKGRTFQLPRLKTK